MSEEKHKFVTNTYGLPDAALVPRQARSKDLTDIQPIGYLSGLKAEDNTSFFTRDTILRLIATLSKK